MSTLSAPEELAADTLSPQQHEVIALLTTGHTVTAAAQQANVHRSTISYWHRTHPDFAEALRTARADRAQHWQSFADQRAEAAFHRIDQLMADDQAPWTVRFKAIQLIVTQAMKEPAPPSDQQLAAEHIIRHTYAQLRHREAVSAGERELLAAEAQVLASEPPAHQPNHCTCLRCLTAVELQNSLVLPPPPPLHEDEEAEPASDALESRAEPETAPATTSAVHHNSSLFVTDDEEHERHTIATQALDTLIAVYPDLVHHISSFFVTSDESSPDSDPDRQLPGAESERTLHSSTPCHDESPVLAGP